MRTLRKSACRSSKRVFLFLVYVTILHHQTHSHCPFPLTHNLSLPPSLQVFGNPKLQKLCASKLESADSVCIGNQIDQPFLDADLSKLVSGSFSSAATFCYQDSDAPTVCGSDDGSLFSSTSGRCPSNACTTTTTTTTVAPTTTSTTTTTVAPTTTTTTTTTET